MVASAYRGGAFSSEDTRYKYTFDEMKDADLNKTTKGGWVAMLQHYFVSAWAPNADDTNSFYSRVILAKTRPSSATRRRWLTWLPASKPK